MILDELSFPKETGPFFSFRNVRFFFYHLSCVLNIHCQHTNHVYSTYLVERLCIIHCHTDLPFLSMLFSEVLVYDCCYYVEVL
jgi:hypothetical protein